VEAVENPKHVTGQGAAISLAMKLNVNVNVNASALNLPLWGILSASSASLFLTTLFIGKRRRRQNDKEKV
jgi:hypothetical protein